MPVLDVYGSRGHPQSVSSVEGRALVSQRGFGQHELGLKPPDKAERKGQSLPGQGWTHTRMPWQQDIQDRAFHGPDASPWRLECCSNQSGRTPEAGEAGAEDEQALTPHRQVALQGRGRIALDSPGEQSCGLLSEARRRSERGVGGAEALAGGARQGEGGTMAAE